MSNREIYKRSVGPYKDRVAFDGGNIDVDWKSLEFAQLNECYRDNLLLSVASFSGQKLRTSGIYSYVTKGYDLSTSKKDLAQTTALSQPYSVKIAPSEVNSWVNPNGGSTFLTHPAISFGAGDKWTVEVTCNFNGNPSGTGIITSNGDANKTFIGIETTNRYLRFKNESNSVANSTFNLNQFIGKTLVLHLISGGNNILSVYANGILLGTISNPTNVTLSTLFCNVVNNDFNGKIYTYSIWNTALPSSEIARRASVIRSIIPEIESVQIGSQRWATSNCQMVTTPQGTPIQEVQDNANVEKITNQADRDFSSDTGFWNKSAGTTISGGACTIISTAGEYQSINRANALTVGKWYKGQYDITAISAGKILFEDGTTTVVSSSLTTVGTKTFYFQATNTAIIFKRGDTTGPCNATIDNVSIQQVGWSDSQNLYDFVYTNTAGTAEQKTYAACKAAGFWCHYNNNPANGAIYGKLYNWFAVKLLQMDIDYYNTANPTNRWGYHVPSQAEFTTLQTYLGGASVAGGKMKMPGTTYWITPNTGADNSSGFSAVGSNNRSSNGGWSSPGNYSFYWLITDSETTAYKFNLINTSITISNNVLTDKTYGFSLRLIHD